MGFSMHHIYCSCVGTPVASFTVAGSVTTKNFTYTGTTVAIDSIRWDFGDGGTSSLVNPSHTFTAIGMHHVCITFYNPCGSDSACFDINVPCLVAPVAAFTKAGTALSRTFTYTGTTVGVDSVRWTFGDGAFANGLTAAHTYADSGTRIICAIAYSRCGNDTTCDTVKLIKPVAVDGLLLEQVRITPNPAHDELYIENAAGCEVELYDMVGKRLYSEVMASHRQVVDIEVLAAGVYMVRIITPAHHTRVIRLLKQ
ncbi:MAG: PKD domain-containing protein [Bacteroidota bacterium]